MNGQISRPVDAAHRRARHSAGLPFEPVAAKLIRSSMERWEIIERYILLVVAASLLAGAGWLFFVRTNPERATGGGALLLCAYWAVWQALYEDKLGSSEPPSRGERLMMAMWIWGRRLVLGSISGLLALGA